MPTIVQEKLVCLNQINERVDNEPLGRSFLVLFFFLFNISWSRAILPSTSFSENYCVTIEPFSRILDSRIYFYLYNVTR